MDKFFVLLESESRGVVSGDGLFGIRVLQYRVRAHAEQQFARSWLQH